MYIYGTGQEFGVGLTIEYRWNLIALESALNNMYQ